MVEQDGTHFSEAAVRALRYTREFEEWNDKFESLKRAIHGRVSPRDIKPLLKAGADEDRILTLLAFTVDHSNRFPSELMRKRKSLASLAGQLVAVTNHATCVVTDLECDGRFWLALEGLLSWDSVPTAGAIEAQTLKQMRALALLIKERGDLLGELSRRLKKIKRVSPMRDLIAYVWLSTNHANRNFDAEVAYLLTAAHKAVGQGKCFTADLVKKFRQRHLPNLRNGRNSPTPSATATIGPARADKEPKPKRLTFGQRIAGIG